MTDEASELINVRPWLPAEQYCMTDAFRAFLDSYRDGLGTWLSAYNVVWCLRVPGSQRTLIAFELPKGLEPHRGLDYIGGLTVRFTENDETVQRFVPPYGVVIEGNRFNFADDKPVTLAEFEATPDELILKAVIR